ncbi:MAG: DNA translocase FtsK [Chitinophagaceae bacterium]|jgi:S-DNA-T family DNA segregation ATPase FtsK/SpoIIIE|nr:DNA translocase FtsK [Chitinophagaceae bacterium]
MANKLKSKSNTPDPKKLNPEKDVDVTVKEIVKDERTYKIVGAVCLLLSFFLFIAFTSYLFTWRDDHVNVGLGAKIFSATDKVNNLLGALGAYAAYNFIDNGFGIASYLFCTLFFVVGINLLFQKRVFNLWRNIRYVIAGLLVISAAFSFFFNHVYNNEFSWGGVAGSLMCERLVLWIGNLGTACVILLAVFSYIIWRFNPKFKFSLSKFKLKYKEKIAVVENENLAGKHRTEEAKLFVEAKENNLKGNNKGKVTVVLPDEILDSLSDFSLNEKEEQGKTRTSKTNNSKDETEKLALIITNDAEKEESLRPKPKPVSNVSLQIKNDFNENEVPSVIKVHADTPEADEEIFGDYDPKQDLSRYQYPSIDMLETHGSDKAIYDPEELENNKNQIIATLKNYDISIQRIAATVGPTVTLYEIVPAPGVRISRIKNLEDDIALSLAALGIRIIAPIPGKGTIGIEVPNLNKTVVSMRSLLASEKFQNNNFSLPIAIGKKINNEHFIVDLASMPHLLMAGATGQGKSVGINTLLVSLLYKKHPSQLKLVLVDPKKVELSLYRTIERHFLAKLPGEEEPIITDTKKVIATLNALCIEMDNRYDLLKEAGCRNIKEYNEKFIKRKLSPKKGHQFLPFIVLVIDEFADLIMTAGKEIEMPIARLAQLSRAIGIHLIIATQRPSVNIITGIIKANFPARIAFKVSSKIDSRTILDVGGAEQLIGKGDMLISYNGDITRVQCAFVDTPEVDKICDFISEQQSYPDAFMLPEYVDEKELDGKSVDDLADRDSLFEEAARLVVLNQMGSTSLIQRRMKLGYNRAGRLMDQLEMAGIVGENKGSKARDVLLKTEMELNELLDSLG